MIRASVSLAKLAVGGILMSTSPAIAQDEQVFPGWITGCSSGPIGSDQCPAAAVGEFMSQMPIGLLEQDMPNADFETFALEEALRTMGAGVYKKAQSNDCGAVDQALVAGEIMQAKVPEQPNLTGNELALFNHLVRVVDNAGDYIGEGC